MKATKVLIFCIIALLVFLYVQSYMSVKEDYTILQTWLEKVTPETLADKYPIVIFDQIVKPEQLLSTLFAYLYFTVKQTSMTKSDGIMKNTAKYLVLYSTQTTNNIHLISPKYTRAISYGKDIAAQNSKVQYVTLKLKPHQLLVVPMFWSFACDSTEPTNAMYIHDIISLFVR
jgi:hypothetical protein